MDSDSWRGDQRTQDAVERNFEKIGEALNRIRRQDPDRAARVSDIGSIVEFSNVLAHEYD